MLPHPPGLLGSTATRMLPKITAELDGTGIADFGCNSGDGTMVGRDQKARFVQSHHGVEKTVFNQA